MIGKQEQPWYKEWFNSAYYHKLYFERDEQEAENFIRRLIDHLRPDPGSQILDVACGRGRHSKILAEMGFVVTGIDISPDSIEYARQYERDTLSFYLHDMRLPFRGNYFDYAFNFFTSFGYFRTRREHDDAIRTIAKSLKQGGRFVIDYLNVHYAEEHLQHNETKLINDSVYNIHRWDDDDHFYKKITVSDESLLHPMEFTEKVAKFSLGDFTEMLAYQGMQIQEVFGDYNFSSYNVSKTPRMIIISSKGVSEMADKEKRLYSDGRSTDALT